MTPELAEQIQAQGLPDNLTGIYTRLKPIFREHNNQDIAKVISLSLIHI